MSATFNEDVQALKELVLHNPVREAGVLGQFDFGTAGPRNPSLLMARSCGEDR